VRKDVKMPRIQILGKLYSVAMKEVASLDHFFTDISNTAGQELKKYPQVA
jgi:hypothetical protein